MAKIEMSTSVADRNVLSIVLYRQEQIRYYKVRCWFRIRLSRHRYLPCSQYAFQTPHVIMSEMEKSKSQGDASCIAIVYDKASHEGQKLF